MTHTVSGILGIVCALLVVAAIGLEMGYLTSAELGGLTIGGAAFCAAIAFVAACGAYVVEESSYGGRVGPAKSFYRRRGGS